MRSYREKNTSIMLIFFRGITVIAVVGSIIEGDLSPKFLLALPAVYFFPEILLLLWWVVTLPFTLILMLFGVGIYSPLFFISWITDKLKRNHKKE